MSRPLLSQLDLSARHAVPGLALLALAFLSATPLQIPYYGPVAPVLVLGPIHYWGLRRPGLMPPALVFAVGLLLGVLTGAPIGLHAFILLICWLIVAGQRRLAAEGGVLGLWWGFLVLAFAFSALEWLAFSLLYATPLAPGSAVLRALLTAALFPVLDWPMLVLHRRLLRRV